MKAYMQLLGLVGLLLISQTGWCQDDPAAPANDKAFICELTIIGDALYNLHGGIQQGFAYMGMADLGLTFHTGSAGLWKGGELFIHAQNTHGGTASADLIGDLQVASNIENGNQSYILEAYYRQVFGRLSLLAGLHDLNSEFLVSEGGSHFLNSAFGIHSGVALSAPVSIFPLTSPGAVINYRIGESLGLRAAVYDGNPGDFESDPYNLNFGIGKGNGMFSIAEVEWGNCLFTENDYCLKLGSWMFNGEVDPLRSGLDPQVNYGVYAVADMVIVPATPLGTKGIDAFVQFSWAPSDRNISPAYLGGGLLFSSPLGQRPGDAFGLAFAHAAISPLASLDSQESLPGIPQLLAHETAIEFSYRIGINEILSIQPDIQYIIQPGANPDLGNAWVAMLRVEAAL